MCKISGCLECFELDGAITVHIVQDDMSLDPREEFDNLARMACYHRRYNLGDKLEYSDIGDLIKYIRRGQAFYLPLYLYEHGGLSISCGRLIHTEKGNLFSIPTYPYDDMFDSGLLGFIYMDKAAVRKEWNVKRISKRIKDIVYRNLEAEVKVYNQYLTGSVYGFVTTCDVCGDELDSCWGFYADNMRDLLEQIKDYVDGSTCDNCKAAIQVSLSLQEV